MTLSRTGARASMTLNASVSRSDRVEEAESLLQFALLIAEMGMYQPGQRLERIRSCL